jgi:hypothetical protein
MVLAIEASRLGHSFRSAAGRSAQQKVGALRREDAQNGVDDGGLANAGPPVMTNTLDVRASRIAATWRTRLANYGNKR